jgi:hypothetical protein
VVNVTVTRALKVVYGVGNVEKIIKIKKIIIRKYKIIIRSLNESFYNFDVTQIKISCI